MTKVNIFEELISYCEVVLVSVDLPSGQRRTSGDLCQLGVRSDGHQESTSLTGRGMPVLLPVPCFLSVVSCLKPRNDGRHKKCNKHEASLLRSL